MNLNLRHIYKRFGERELFRDLSVDIPKGQICCVRTGVLDGGSTLLKCMAGIIEVDSGAITLDGKPYSHYSSKELFDAVTFCYESGGLMDVFTNYNNILIPLTYHRDISTDETGDRIDRISTALGISECMDYEPFQLNDVQKRLMNLVKALVIQPQLIFVDELQSGMSDEIRDSVLQFLLDEQQRMSYTIVMTVTAGDIVAFADKTYAISDCHLTDEVA